MKNLTIIFFAYFSFIFSLNGQIKISEDTISMSQGLKNGLSVEMQNISPAEAESRWDSHLKPYKAKTKKVKNSNEWFTDNAKMKLLSNNTVDVYAVFTPIQNGTRLIVWYDLGGTFLNSKLHGEQANAGKKVLYDFALSVKKEQTVASIKQEEEKLKQIQSDMEKLSKNEKDFLKTIDELNAKIAQLEVEVKNNKSGQSQKQVDLDNQKKLIEDLKKKLDSIK